MPPGGSLPPFSWSAYNATSHVGLPETYDFVSAPRPAPPHPAAALPHTVLFPTPHLPNPRRQAFEAMVPDAAVWPISA